MLQRIENVKRLEAEERNARTPFERTREYRRQTEDHLKTRILRGKVIVYVVRSGAMDFSIFSWIILLTVLSCGFWLIWIFIREMRNRSTPQI